MTLTLLRHGRTMANEQRLYCGASDPSLSPSGREELQALALSRPLPRFDLTVDTGMRRTIETANLLTDAVTRRSCPALQEMYFGRFEGFAYETLRYDPDYIAWITDESGDYTCPGGESRNHFYARVQAGFADFLHSAHGEQLCLVCHGGVICAIMDSFCPEQRGFYDWQPAFGHGWQVTVTKEAGRIVLSNPKAL